jgi:hypothetical protein
LAIVFAEDMPDTAKAYVPRKYKSSSLFFYQRNVDRSLIYLHPFSVLEQWSELCPIYDAQTPDQLAVDPVAPMSSSATSSTAAATTVASATILSSATTLSIASSGRPVSTSTPSSGTVAASTTDSIQVAGSGGIGSVVTSGERWLDGLLGHWLHGRSRYSRHGRDFGAHQY